MPTKRSSKVSRSFAQYTASAVPTRYFVEGVRCGQCNHCSHGDDDKYRALTGVQSQGSRRARAAGREAVAAIGVGGCRLFPASAHGQGVRTVLVAAFLTRTW